MKKTSFVIAPLLAAALVACQRQATPERVAVASPAPAASGGPVATQQAAEPAAEAAPGGRIEPATGVAPSGPVDARQPSPRPVEPAVGAASPELARSEPPLVLRAGTALRIRLAETLASDKSEAEQKVLAELADDVRVDGRVALTAGSEVIGHVVIAQRSGRVKGRARLVVAFDEIRAGNRSYPIEAARWDVTAASSRDRDAKIAGGAAAAGLLIGAITGGGKGALKGGLIGGAAGGAAVLVTRGKEVELRAGVPHRITLRRALRIE